MLTGQRPVSVRVGAFVRLTVLERKEERIVGGCVSSEL